MIYINIGLRKSFYYYHQALGPGHKMNFGERQFICLIYRNNSCVAYLSTSRVLTD